VEDRSKPGASNACRRPEVRRGPSSYPIDDRLCSVDLVGETRGKKECKVVWMAPCVVLDSMSAFSHFANQGLVLLNQLSDAKKACPCAVFIEYVENARCQLRVWTIVKGQGHGSRPILLSRQPGHIGPENSAPGEKAS